MKPEDVAPINSSAKPWHIGFRNEIADMLRPSGDWHPDIVRYEVVQVCDFDGKHVCWAKSPEHAALIVDAVNKYDVHNRADTETGEE